MTTILQLTNILQNQEVIEEENETSVFPAVFTISGEIFTYMTSSFFFFYNPTIEIITFHLHGQKNETKVIAELFILFDQSIHLHFLRTEEVHENYVQEKVSIPTPTLIVLHPKSYPEKLTLRENQYVSSILQIVFRTSELKTSSFISLVNETNNNSNRRNHKV